MKVGDWLIYYSPTERMGDKVPCQRFTAIGKVAGEEVYPYEMHPGFVPFRRDIQFLAAEDVAIRPLLLRLSFIRDKSRWGYVFRFGHLEIPREDFEVIAVAMLGYLPSNGGVF
jgi:hypothetical protein